MIIFIPQSGILIKTQNLKFQVQMDSSDISRLYFQHRAYMDATKKEKEISNSRMSPKNISN